MKNNKHSIFSGVCIAVSFLACGYIGAQTINLGQEQAVLCAGCHGGSGISLTDDTPNLAGQKQLYLIKQLNDFKKGKRQSATMNAMAASLTEQDIADVSHYFSQLDANPIENNRVLKEKSDKATSAEFPQQVFFSLKGSGKIASFSDGIVADGGPNMLYTAVTPNSELLLSTSPSTDSVYVFATNTLEQLAIIKAGKAPKGVKVTPDGKFAYVSNQGSNDISVIDLQTLKNITTIATKSGPHNVRFTDNGKLAYVTLQGGAGLGVIDTQSRKMVKVIAVPGITGPHNLDLSKDEKTAFVRDFVHHVAVLDLTNDKVVKVIEVGKGHGGIDVAPNGKFVATAAIADSVITIIDTKTLATSYIEVGKGPHGVRASKNSQWLYVTLTGENKIAVINTQTMQVVKKIIVDKFPFWLAVQGNP